MLGGLVEDEHVAGDGLDGVGGHLTSVRSPFLFIVVDSGLGNDLVQAVGVTVAHTVGAGNHSQAARVLRHRVEVEGDLDVLILQGEVV